MSRPKKNAITVEDLARMVQNEFEETTERMAGLGRRVVQLGRRLDAVERRFRNLQRRLGR